MKPAQPMHAALCDVPVQDGWLQIGGTSLDRVAWQAGTTPFYAYDRQRITDRVSTLRKHLPRQVSLFYAIKANPMPALVQHLAGLVDGFDVASGGELKTALDTVMLRDRISFAGPGKDDGELTRAIAAGIIVSVESESELARVAQLGRQMHLSPRIVVRVNPAGPTRSYGMTMGGGATPFGIDAERVPALLPQVVPLGLDFHGFHLFCGSQCLDAQTILATFERMVQTALELAHHYPAPLRIINIGGGFGVPYFAGERPLCLTDIGITLGELAARVQRHQPQARLVVELGRYLVGEAGYYVCRVLARKVSRDRVFVITDGGLHHHLAASGNLGQVLRKNFPIIIGNKVGDIPTDVCTVVGRLCTPLDRLAEHVELPQCAAGDYVVVLQSGAYGMTASPIQFLGHPPPPELLL